MDRDQSDIVTKLMGQYLLKGYALLSESCSVCEGPLMRSRNNEMICVSCQVMARKPSMEAVPSISNSGDKTVDLAEDNNHTYSSQSLMKGVERCLLSKISWASAALESEKDVDKCIQLNKLVGSLLKNIQMVRQLDQ